MYRKLVEAVVAALVEILKKRAPAATGDMYAGGAMRMAAHLVRRDDADLDAVMAKLHRVFQEVSYDWPHTKLAESRLVEAIIA